MARWQLKMAFLQTLVRRRAGGKTRRRTFLPARPRMRDFEFSLAILHPTPLRKGMRDTKMARWQLKKPFFANPSCVRRKKTFAKKKFPAYARESLKFHLPSCHLKAFFDILRQKNDNDNEDESLNENVKRRRKRMAILFVVYTVLRV